MTVTAVAWALDQVIVVAPGAEVVVGVARRVALTGSGGVTVTVVVAVTGPP